MPFKRVHHFLQMSPAIWLAVLLSIQTAMLGWAATRHSPGIDEVGHLAAGLHHWQSRTFDLYRVNPPLVRLVATAPLVLIGVELPQRTLDTASPVRPEFDLGRELMNHYGERSFWYLTVARWACIPFALLGTTVIYLWGRDLFGSRAGLLSAVLWVFCPFVLANAQMITPDTGAASLGSVACFLFWRWIRRPRWILAVAAGTLLGLAGLTKLTWVILPAIWLTSWLMVIVRNPGRTVAVSSWGQFRQLIITFLVALYVVNAGYGFEGTGRPLAQYKFLSRALTAETDDGERVNRFQGTWLGTVPVLLPRNYVQGVDAQKRDFEAGMRSYLRGEWRTEGWWYYYLYGLAVKTPIGTLSLFGLAILSCLFACQSRPGWRVELLLLLPGLTVLGFVSSQTGFNHHLRYVLPAFPFLFIWLGRVVLYRGPGQVFWRLTIGMAMLGTVVSSLSVYPHSMSYFNEAVGGPARGSEHLVDSNIDWGQDLLNLKRWLDQHREARPLGLAYFGFIDPRIAGIEFHLPPKGPRDPADFLDPQPTLLGPRPGWYAISVSILQGYHFPLSDGKGGMEFIEGECYAYFHRFRPVAMAGYSIRIYHLQPDECNRVRLEMGLPALSNNSAP